MPREYYVVDAFSTGRFTGNPAAVLFDPAGLSDDQLRSIAAEFNLSETTFIYALNAGDDALHRGNGSADEDQSPAYRFQFRWFTPTVEVSMCGHATVAAVHALVESGRVQRGDQPAVKLAIDTMSGRITAFVETWPGEGGGLVYWLELIPPQLSPGRVDRSELARCLGLELDSLVEELPLARTQDLDLIAVVRDALTLNDAKPDFNRLKNLCAGHDLRGVCLTTTSTLTPSINVQSRFFAPSAGVNEDPVTGSVHGPLCAYMVKHGLIPVHGDTAGLVCVQGIPGGRTGMLYGLVRIQEDGTMIARIGGKAITTMRGLLLVD